MSQTGETTNQIVKFLFENKVFSWRQNSGGIFDRSKHLYRAGTKKGVSDILGIIGFEPWHGRALAIEVKTGTDRLRPEQEGFLKSVRDFGGVTFVVADFEDFEKQWNILLSHLRSASDIAYD